MPMKKQLYLYLGLALLVIVVSIFVTIAVYSERPVTTVAGQLFGIKSQQLRDDGFAFSDAEALCKAHVEDMLPEHLVTIDARTTTQIEQSLYSASLYAEARAYDGRGKILMMCTVDVTSGEVVDAYNPEESSGKRNSPVGI